MISEISRFCVEHSYVNCLSEEETQQLCNWQTKLNEYSNKVLLIKMSGKPKKKQNNIR